MAEYIERQKVFDSLPIVAEDKIVTLYGAVADFMVLVSAIPAADVVEVVRCKDCKHKKVDGAGDLWCDYHDGYWPSRNDFCSHGERKAGE